MSTNELEQLNQYISGVLIPRLNYVDALLKQDQPFRALLGVRSLILVLQMSTEVEERQKRDWLSRIDAVRSIQGTGSARMFRIWDTEARRNAAAAILCEELHAEVWGFLHDKGYFNLDQISKFHDPSRGRKS